MSPITTSKTTGYQLGAKIRFSPNKCGSQSTLTLSIGRVSVGHVYRGKMIVDNDPKLRDILA